ncbi:MAG: BrnA antitoxin family protein [Beijerinckiaceae bacterium]
MTGKTDYARHDDHDELRRQELADEDLQGIAADWHKSARLETGIPAPLSARNKQAVTMRLDAEIVEHFKAQGRGWQTRINAVLKAYIESRIAESDRKPG